MNIYSWANLRTLMAHWVVINNRHFTKAEKAFIKKAKVIQTPYGKSIKFYLKKPTKHYANYIPLSTESSWGVKIGQIIPLNKMSVCTLQEETIKDIIYRINIQEEVL